MAELARRERSGTVAEAAAARGALDPREALRYLGLSEKDPRAHALLLVCDRYGLDPLLGHISIYKEKIYVHFAAYLHLANQHSAYQGMECVREWEDAKYCYAEVRVHRSDRAFPFQRRGKSLKVKPRKDGKGTYDDAEADAKAFAQAARRALRLAFNVDWPEPEAERDPGAEEPAAPGPVTEVVRRVDAAQPHVAAAEPVPPPVEEDFDPETGEVYEIPQGEMDEYGWPRKPDEAEAPRPSAGASPAGPAGRGVTAGPAAPPSDVPEWAQNERAQRTAHGRRGARRTSAAEASAPAGPAADASVPGAVAAGGTGDPTSPPAGQRGRAGRAGGDDPSLLEDGDQP